MAHPFFPLKSLPKRDDLYYPDLNDNISKILPSVLTLFDYKYPTNETLLTLLSKKEGWKRTQEIETSNILFVTLDALGLSEFMKYSKLLRKTFDLFGIPLSSVFPTITSTCIASLKFGVMPINHGILGHKINFSEIGNIVDTLTLKTDMGVNLSQVGVNVKNWVWSDFPVSKIQNINHLAIIENYIANSGLSELVNEKQNAIGHYSHIDCFAAVQRILETHTSFKNLIDIYIGSIDAISHRYTTESQTLMEEIQNIEELFFRMLKKLDAKVASETVVVITADHGQENLSSENKIIITSEDEAKISPLLKSRGRSGRVIHLFSEEGKQDEVVEWFSEKIGDKGVVITDEKYPLFMGKGARNPKIIERMGDAQIILGKNASMFFGHSGEYSSTYNLGLNATHGSLSKSELLVPLIIGRVSDLLEIV
ncbi:MAG: alkaline phosphatase family protein [Candidatus Heimdallarchaeota archaeon]|nr:alkaline phosphatase family protein [Candidatus Heimdallarchaeota archaeon]